MGNSVSPVDDFLNELSERGIRLELRGDQLAYFPRRKLTAGLRQRLVQLKPEIVHRLRGVHRKTEYPEPVETITETPRIDHPPVSVVISDPQTKSLENLLINVLTQRPVPAEILITGKTNRRIRKIVNRFRSRDVRIASSSLDVLHDFVCLMAPNTQLGPDWLAKAVQTINGPEVGTVYSDHELIQTGERTDYPEHVTANDLARSGIQAPTILVRREALVAANYSGEPLNVLLRKLSRSRWELLKHSGIIYAQSDRKESYFQRQHLNQETVTLFIPLSGRKHLWPKVAGFLEKQTWPRHQLRLILCDTSRDKSFSNRIRSWISTCDYPDVRNIRLPSKQAGLADLPRDQQLIAVNEQMCRIYNLLRAELTTDYVWILEDDIIPPNDVLSRLLNSFDENVASVSAPYRSRFDGRYLAWSRERAGNAGVHQLCRPLPDRPQVEEIRGSGFGCLVMRAEVLKQRPFCLPQGETCYDVRFFRELEPRWKRLVDWTTACQHLHNVPQPKSNITTRNLIYHITPFATNDIWLRNVRQLLKRIDLFNGRIVIAIATGEGLIPVEEVRQAFGNVTVEIITRPNSAQLRENVTFLRLLESVADPDPHTATFYAHAKGVGKDVCCLGPPRGSRYWRNAMYHELLDDWTRINELLIDSAIVGTHRRQHNENHQIYPDGQSTSPWHFAGTFFWFRNRNVFSTDRWREVWQPTGWGAEAWPGRMFDFEQSACVAYDGLEDLYNPDVYFPQIEDE